MSIHGIGSSAASWAQFVKVKQAAAERNGGLQVRDAEGAGRAAVPQAADPASFRKFAEAHGIAAPVITGAVTPETSVSRPAPTPAVSFPGAGKTAGGLFDAYA